MKKIVCYGDSNTFGYDSVTRGRFSEKERWCGILQENICEYALIIERGLNGRTIAFDDDFIPGRNGMNAVDDEVFAEGNIDLLVIMLGTNDCKSSFSAGPSIICEKMDEMTSKVLSNDSVSEVLLLSPVPMNENCAKGFMGFGADSSEISRQLAEGYRKIAEKHSIHFADTTDWGVELTNDGCHYTVAGHKRFAEKITEIINEIIKG